MDGGTQNIDGDGDFVDVVMDNITLTEPYSSNAQLPSNASTEQNDKILRDFQSLVSFTDTSELGSLDLNVSPSLDLKDTGSISKERKFKSLKHRWLCQPGSKKANTSGGGDKVGHSIVQGSLVTL